MTLKMKRKGKGLDDTSIILFEQRYRLILPNDYRLFIAENNGGVPETNILDIPGFKKGDIGIDEFLPLTNIESIKKMLGDRVPLNAWPIADAAGGNFICLVIGEKAGVYFWDHELEADEDQLPSWENMFFITENFTDFWSSLRPFDISEVKLKPGQVISVWIHPDFKPKCD